MITPEYIKLMAQYNTWQNGSILRAADGLSDEDRNKDRGAFFGSISGTLCHLLWGDHMWLARFADMEMPAITIKESATYKSDWIEFMTARRDTDLIISNWANALDAKELAAQLNWHSGAVGRDMSEPLTKLIVHFFNHQTHHRGQVHAMLTQAGATPEETDLPFMPDTAS